MNFYWIFYTASFYLPVILSYSLPTFIYKDLTEYYNNYEIIVFYHIVYHLFILSFIGFFFAYDKKHIVSFFQKSKKLPSKLFAIVFAIVLLGLISQYSYFYLLRHLGVNEILSVVRGASVVLVLLIGYFIYKENLTVLKILGIFLVLAGMLLINNF